MNDFFLITLFLLPTSNVFFCLVFVLRTSYFQLPTSYFLLPTAYFLLPTSYFILLFSFITLLSFYFLCPIFSSVFITFLLFYNFTTSIVCTGAHYAHCMRDFNFLLFKLNQQCILIKTSKKSVGWMFNNKYTVGFLFLSTFWIYVQFKQRSIVARYRIYPTVYLFLFFSWLIS